MAHEGQELLIKDALVFLLAAGLVGERGAGVGGDGIQEGVPVPGLDLE